MTSWQEIEHQYYMFAVQPRGCCGSEEKLGAIGAGASVGHAEYAGLGMFELKVLISKFSAVDGFSSGTIAVGKIAALTHEVGNDAVECRTLIVQGFPGLALTSLSGTQGTKIFGCFRHHVSSELYNDTSCRFLTNGDVKKDLRISLVTHAFLISLPI